MQKGFYCKYCKRNTAHKRIRRDSIGEDVCVVFRPLLAVVSLGASEMTGRPEYACNVCGSVSRHRD